MAGRQRAAAEPEEQQSGKKTFTARLKQGHTYKIFGMKFRRGVPRTDVPMKYYKALKANGYFTVSNVNV